MSLLVRTGNGDQVDVTGETKTEMAAHASQMEVIHLLSLIQLFTNAANETKAAWQPALPLEMAFIEGIDLLKGIPTPKEHQASKAALNINSQSGNLPKSETENVPIPTTPIPQPQKWKKELQRRAFDQTYQ
jgi:DNA polymerase III gamma/tau subunit